MINDNIIRNSAVTRDLESIEIDSGYYHYTYKGSDIADFKIENFGTTSKISILTIEGFADIFYNAFVRVRYKNQEKLKSTGAFEEEEVNDNN